MLLRLYVKSSLPLLHAYNSMPVSPIKYVTKYVTQLWIMYE